jgi:gamma-glutamylcyclotransferase (GGCT)/AIG2-like uncharacterized protein YtfP
MRAQPLVERRLRAKLGYRTGTMSSREVTLFVYGTLLMGDASHELLTGARLVGEVRTLPRYALVDLGAYPGLVAGGDVAVAGELWTVDVATLAKIDVHEGHPVLFERRPVELEGGVIAEAYQLDVEQVRGRRRIRSGSWRERHERPAAAASARDSPFARALRSRVR